MAVKSTTAPTPTRTVVINVSALQAFPPSHLNRDETGAQKTSPIGGTLRTRVSSAAWKRPMRQALRREAISEGSFSHRTNRLPEEVADKLVELGIVTDPDVAASKTAAMFLAMELNLKEGKLITNNSTFVREDAPVRIAEGMRAHIDSIRLASVSDDSASDDSETGEGSSKGSGKGSVQVPEAAKKAFRAAFDIDGAIDLALFGSFVATKKINVRHDGALSVNHAYSVDPARIIQDFYVNVDDLATNERDDDHDTFSNNIGVSDLSAQVFYRSMALDVNQLSINLDGDEELTAAAIKAALNVFINSVPAAKQRSSNAGTRPAVILLSVGSSRLTHDNAFVRAIRSDEVIRDATKALFQQAGFNSALDESHSYIALAASADAQEQLPDPETFPAEIEIVSSVGDLMEAVSKKVAEASK